MDGSILSLLNEASKDIFKIIPIQETQALWLDITCGSEHSFLEYDYENILYQCEYYSSSYNGFVNASVLIDISGIYILWPMSVYKDINGNYVLGSNGVDLVPPLIDDQRSNEETQRKLINKCMLYLHRLCVSLKIDMVNFRCMHLGNGYSHWERKMLEAGAQAVSVSVEAFVDLTLDEDVILKKIRRTNRYSIKKGEDLWRIEIISKESGENQIDRDFARLEDLHLEVAGRKTRTENSWLLQKDMLKNSNAFLIMMYDISDTLIGASFFQICNLIGMYSVAAYNRSLFDQPIAHVSQWYAIKHMKTLGVKWYYIGRIFYPGDPEIPTAKELSISRFKEGFATNLFERIRFSYRIPLKD